MDDVIRRNRERWDELSAAGVRYSLPRLDLDVSSARAMVDPEGQLVKVRGRKVLCLAASGGQQSAAFALLGAKVTVFDLSGNQLEKDRLAARHYGVELRTVQGDMQDLSVFGDASFDIAWMAHSINFVPRAAAVLREAGRVCRRGGRLRINFTNPYVHGLWDRKVEGGFLLSEPYVDGAPVTYSNPWWTFKDPSGKDRRVEGPTEFRHSLATIINGLRAAGFAIDGFWEEVGTHPAPPLGSWEHFMKAAPPWLTIWATRTGRRNRRGRTAVIPGDAAG